MKLVRLIAASSLGFALAITNTGTPAAPAADWQSSTRAPVSSSATPEQLARLQEKLEIAQRIVKSVKADAEGKGATPDWSIGLASVLYGLSNEALRRIEPGLTTLDQAHAAAANEASAARATAGAVTPKALGDANNDLVFTPIVPCRFVDTRNVGGPVSTTLRVFDTANPGATYGGSSGCTLSGNGAPAVALNLTIVIPSATGYLIVRPQGSSNTTSFINWDNGTIQLANAGIVTTTLENNGHYEFEIFNNAGGPQVVIDYFGYFSAPAGTITGNGGGADGVDGVTSGAYNSGVFGKNTGGGKGVFGASATGQAVAGGSTSGYGIYGNSATGTGVYGQTQGSAGFSGAAGVWGDSQSYFGVWGTSSSGAGVWGESKSYDGVHGHTAGGGAGVAGFGDGSSAGLFGLSQTGNGAYGTSTSSNGVEGNSAGSGASGVYGQNSNVQGYGVYGRNTSGGYGIGTDGPAFQTRTQGGWVKAMFVYNPFAAVGSQIATCYNSQIAASSASTPPCGITIQNPSAGTYYFDFGFEVDDRIFSVTTQGSGHPTAAILGDQLGGFYSATFTTPSKVVISTFDSSNGNLQNAIIYVVVF
jgi:hypothetical protein